MATPGDERQKNDATFNAGLNSGSLVRVRGHGEPPALLHPRQAHRRPGHPALQGRRQVARRRRPADARRRARRRRSSATPRATRPARSTSTNTGAAAATPDVHPQDAVGVPEQRHLPAVRDGDRHGLDARTLKNAFATAKFGESVTVPVYIEKGTGARHRHAEGDLGERSDQDGDGGLHAGRRQRRRLGAGHAGADAWARRRRFGAFTPGLGKDYFATTTATVISTAGDATLTRRRSVHDRYRPPGQRRVLAAAGAAGAGSRRDRRPTRRRRLAAPTTLKTWAGPVSNDPVPISFKQTIGVDRRAAHGHVRKTLTFTLSTTNP